LDVDKNDAATAGPKLVVIGGVSYLASPLDDRSHTALLDWVKKRLRNPLLEVADDFDKLPPAMQEKAVKAALELKTAGGVTPGPEAYREQLSKPAGCAFLAWLMIRRDHPTVPLEALQAAITEDNAVQIMADLFEASGLAALGKGRTSANGSTSGNDKTEPTSTAA
jgi:hypothetical protein